MESLLRWYGYVRQRFNVSLAWRITLICLCKMLENEEKAQGDMDGGCLFGFMDIHPSAFSI